MIFIDEILSMVWVGVPSRQVSAISQRWPETFGTFWSEDSGWMKGVLTSLDMHWTRLWSSIMLNLESTISTDTECAWIAGEKMQRPWIHWLHLHSILHSIYFICEHIWTMWTQHRSNVGVVGQIWVSWATSPPQVSEKRLRKERREAAAAAGQPAVFDNTF